MANSLTAEWPRSTSPATPGLVAVTAWRYTGEKEHWWHHPRNLPTILAYNVGQMYYQFGEGIRSGEPCQPDFNTAVELHQLIDSIQEASEQGREVAVTK